MSLHRPSRVTATLAALVIAATGFTVGSRIGRPALEVAGPHTVAAQAAPGPVYALPVLDMLGEDDICQSWLGVQNVGTAATQAVLVVLGGAAPGAAGDPLHSFPVGVMCTGLIRPGSSWHMAGALIPSGTDPNPSPTPGGGSFSARQANTPVRVGRRAALVFSVGPDRLADILDDPDGTAIDDIAANRLCELLHVHARASSAAWSDFLAAWWSGRPWHELPLGAIAGEPLRVQLHRACPGAATPGTEVTATYDAPRVPAADASAYRTVVGGLSSHVTGRSRVSILYVQNVGHKRASVSVRFMAEGACSPDPSGKTLGLLPGDAGFVEVIGLVEDGWRGSAIVEADEPVVVAAEVIEGDSVRLESSLATAVGTAATAGPRYASVFVGPGDHTVTAHVVNAGQTTVRPRLTLRAGSGLVVGSPIEGGPLCPGGSATLRLSASSADPFGGAFLAKVDAVGSDAGSDAGAVQLQATVEVAMHASPTGGEVHQAYTLTARPVRVAADVADMAPLAVPIAMRALESVGLDVDLSISLVDGAPGTLVFAVLAYDHNGLVGSTCRMIESGRSVLVPIAEVQGLLRNMRGAAIIAVKEWHPAPGAVGPPGALVASTIVRRGTLANEGIPGDEIAAAAALPIEGATSAVPVPPPCDPAPEPPPAAAVVDRLSQSVLFAPTIRFVGQDDVCLAAVRVTNRDSAPVQVVAVSFFEAGFVDPLCAGPPVTACSPLLAPGESWDYFGGLAPGVFVGLKGDALDALGLVADESRTAAEVLCEEGGLDDDCHAWRRFALALRTGGRVHSFRLANVAAPISAVVARSCPSASDPRAEELANYDAVSLADILRGRTQPDRYVYTVARGYASSTHPTDPIRSRHSILYLQNAGERTVGIGLTFHGDDGSAVSCSISALAAGESYPFDVGDCVGPEWSGWIAIVADGPLAVMADVLVEPLTSRGSTAGGNRCDVNADGRVDEDDIGAVYDAEGSAPGGARWNARADLDHSGVIDIEDLRIAAACLPGAGPTVVSRLPIPDPTRTLVSPHVTAGPDGTPRPRPTATPGRRPAAIYLPYGYSNVRR